MTRVTADSQRRLPLPRWVFSTAIALTVAAILYFGLDPLELRPANHVQRIEPQRGIEFDYAGIAWAAERIGPLPARLRVEIDARPTGWALPGGLGTLLTLEDGTSPPVLVVAQWRSSLVVRLRTREGVRLRYRELAAENVFEAGRARRIELLSNAEAGTHVMVDGVEVARSSLPIVPAGTEIWTRPVLGSKGDGSGSWRGVIQSLVIDRQDAAFGAAPTWSLSTALAGHGPAPLVIPESFDPPSPGFLTLPERRQLGTLWLARDLLFNVLGFAPLGAILYTLFWAQGYGPARATAMVTACALGLSFAIETLQIFLPLRVSSLTDLLFNWLGALLGAAGAAAWLRWGKAARQFARRLGRRGSRLPDDQR
jgi:hypothetical protein